MQIFQSNSSHAYPLLFRRIVSSFLTAILLGALTACSGGSRIASTQGASDCRNVTTAHVAAIEQVYQYNRYGAYNPQGMVYALRRDLVEEESGEPIPLLPGTGDQELAGNVSLRSDKRPRPLVLRVNDGDCLEVTFTNLLPTSEDGEERRVDPENGRMVPLETEEPRTRKASIHVNGLELAGDIRSDGTAVGRNPSGLVAPGESVTYRWLARGEGGYLLYSMADAISGEGNGGQLGLGLFGSVNVEPKGSRWYRSQVSHSDMVSASTGTSAIGTPTLDYDRQEQGVPLLALTDPNGEIVHSDLNAVIAPASGENCAEMGDGPDADCGAAFREFTAIFHDELTTDQAFHDLSDESNPIHSLRDGMGINYGASGLGAMVLANRDDKGPGGGSRYVLDETRDCIECKLEEFFLTAWVVGDPAMVVKRDENQRAQEALYPDDPANVHHSYLGDPVRFRNIHAGPKETHVFHLHAHQWVRDPQSDKSIYLDSQTIGPGSSYTYQISYGGAGNRNLEVGDSIYHCHLYPHFAQGMWAMWRAHDTFEDGMPVPANRRPFDPGTAAGPNNDPRWRNLPDTELAQGSRSPAVVPIPGRPLPPLPTAEMPGYPFYIAGQIGHRPPQPPRDMDSASADPADPLREDGGLPRHVIVGGKRTVGTAAIDEKYLDLAKADSNALSPASVANARRVRNANGDARLFALASELDEAQVKLVEWDGTAVEKRAEAFHEGLATSFGTVPAVTVKPSSTHKPDDQAQTWWEGVGYASCDSAGNCFNPATPDPRLLFRVNGKPGVMGAPFADPCPTGAPQRTYRSAYLQFDMPVNKYGWHDPQARAIVLERDMKETIDGTRPAEPFFVRANSGECVVFKATNLVPSVLNLDDFQVYTPTDAIGQHIHLVKFDVTSSDGSANGWNYEDSTLSADEVRERIIANNHFQTRTGGSQMLAPKTHRIFRAGGEMAGDVRGQCPADPAKWNEHPWCGAQTTVQRWWADPLRDNTGRDRTIRTVFTHDHLGPSSHQHHGFYAALVVEPTGSEWTSLDGSVTLGKVDGTGTPVILRDDGGPTSWAANILTPDGADKVNGDRREFNLAFADYAIVYDAQNRPINPPNVIDHDLPSLGVHGTKPFPEGISTKDPGTQLLNYRNEPVPLRIAEQSAATGSWSQRGPGVANDCLTDRVDALGQPVAGATKITEGNAGQPAIRAAEIARICNRGDIANAFSSRTHGDPSTPLLPVYQGDRVQIRLIQGAQEENHVFELTGTKWLAQPGLADSGWMASQQLGISEHFEFDVEVTEAAPKLPVDHMLFASASDNLWDGQWALLRAYQPHLELHRSDGSLALARLRSNPQLPAPLDTAPNMRVCAPTARDPRFEIVAMRAADLTGDAGGVYYNREHGIYDPNAIVFFEKRFEAALRSGAMPLEPLVLRAPAGSCIGVQVYNRLPQALPDGLQFPQSWSYNAMPPITQGFNFNDFRSSSRIGFHAQLVTGNTYFDDGANIGANRDSTFAPLDCPLNTLTANCSFDALPMELRWYAGDAKLRFQGGDAGTPRNVPVEYGVVTLRDFGDVIKHSSHGAIGALVIEPEGASQTSDCDALLAAQRTISRPCNAAATVAWKDHDGKARRFRELVVQYQDDLSLFHNGAPMPNLGGDDDSEDTGQRAFSYRMEPLWARVGASESIEPEDLLAYDFSDVLSSFRCADHSARNPCADGQVPAIVDPGTPLLVAGAGDPLRLRVTHPGGHPRNHAFTFSGHSWQAEPYGNYADANADIGSRWQGDGANGWSRRRYGAVGGVGPGRDFNLLVGPAGGTYRVPGDYLYRSMDGLAFMSGQWGIVRVLPKCPASGFDAEGNACK